MDVHLGIWASGPLGFWASGHLSFWASGLLGIWASRPLGFWASGLRVFQHIEITPKSPPVPTFLASKMSK